MQSLPLHDRNFAWTGCQVILPALPAKSRPGNHGLLPLARVPSHTAWPGCQVILPGKAASSVAGP